MARQVLPLVGGIVGSFFGNPQLGFAIGSLIGNAVDPQVIKGPTLKEIPSQTAGEGSFRQVVYGTSWINDTNVLDFGDVVRVKTRTRQSKGGGPVVEGERLERTYAIGLGEPFAAIRVIRRNGTIVYDVRPDSTILAESAAFAARFRFYDGSETQLPDPDLEALPHNGVGNTPSYRGTAYLVFPRDDLTDLRGQIPTYEVEATNGAESVATSPVSLVTSSGWYSGSASALAYAGEIGGGTSVLIARVTDDGNLIAYVNGAVSQQLNVKVFNEEDNVWDALSIPMGFTQGSVMSVAWSPQFAGGVYYLAVTSTTTGQYLALFKVAAGVVTLLASNPASPPTSKPPQSRGLDWDIDGARIAGEFLGDLYIYDFDVGTERFVSPRFIAPPTAPENPPGQRTLLPYDGIHWQGVTNTRFVAAGAADGIFVVRDDTSSASLAAYASVAGDGIWGRPVWDATGGYLIVGQTNDSAGRISVAQWSGGSPGFESITFDSNSTDTVTGFVKDISINLDGTHIAVACDGDDSPVMFALGGSLPPAPVKITSPDPSFYPLTSADFRIGFVFPPIPEGKVFLREIIEDICDRCGLPASKYDVSALDDIVDGITLGGAYSGAGAITTLMPAYFFDLFEADKKINAVKRGAAVKDTVVLADLIEEPDENSLRGQDTEYPRQLMVKYLNPGQNYAAPAAVVSRKTPDIRVRGEVKVDLPINMGETQALQTADRMLKVMWEDLNGEVKFSLPLGPWAWLTPSDCLGLQTRSGELFRIRVEKVEDAGRQLMVTARRDRQSAYTSNLTAIPLPTPAPPPPTLPGPTAVALLNVPGVVDEDDRVGFRIGVCGQPGSAWYGANVAYSSDGGLNWTDLGNITARAVMGELTAPLPFAPEAYTDATNTLGVSLIDVDELESLTYAQFLAEGNGAAIVRDDYTAELVQFRYAEDLGSQEWALTTLQRGRLTTSTAAHDAGARFVMLDGTVFLPLPSGLIGASLKIRVTSLGTSPETAPVFDFDFAPAYSQTEFPPAHLFLDQAGDTITASAVPRHRFGTEDAPVQSIRWTGYRWTATDGTNTATNDTGITAPTTTFDVTGWASPVSVTVAMTNQFTGAGPSISENI